MTEIIFLCDVYRTVLFVLTLRRKTRGTMRQKFPMWQDYRTVYTIPKKYVENLVREKFPMWQEYRTVYNIPNKYVENLVREKFPMWQDGK